MWWRLVARSVVNRRSRLAVMAVSLLLGSALVSAFLSLGGGLGERAQRELSAYGPNLMVLPRGFGLALDMGGRDMGQVARRERLPPASLEALAALGELSYAPYLYGVARVQGQAVVIAGTWPGELKGLYPGWQWSSAPGTAQEGGAFVGAQVAAKLGLAPGGRLTLEVAGREYPLPVAGVVETGGSEDHQALLPLGEAQRMLGEEGVDLVVVRAAAGGALRRVAAALEAALPGAEVRVIAQIAQTEAAVLRRLRLLMGLVTALVLVATALAVSSTMTFQIWERRREVGLFKALGAGRGRIVFHFWGEAWAVSLAAALPGYALGLLLARWVALQVFGAPVAFHAHTAPVTLALVLALTTAASYLPVRRAAGVEPAAVLKGE